MLPTRKQYSNWKYPAKLTFWGFWIGLLAFMLMIIFRVIDIGFLNKSTDMQNSNSNPPMEQNDSLIATIDSNYVNAIKSQKTINSKTEIPKQKDDKRITIKDSPGSVATINQRGDNVIINPQVGIPPPKFSIKYISRNVPTDTLFKTELLLTINSAVQINNLYLEAKAPSIVEFSANAQRTGMIQTGHTGKRSGWAFTNIPNAWGRWKLIVLTKDIEDNLEFGYNYE